MSGDDRRPKRRSEVGGRREMAKRWRSGVWTVLVMCAASRAAAAPVQVKDINPGPAASSPAWLTEVDGTLLFAADDGATGAELWRSDGTAAGTVQVKDVNPGGSARLHQLTNIDGTVFFGADSGTGTSFADLWKTDGTASGTVLVDADPGFLFGSLIQMTNAGGTLYFLENHGGGTVSCCSASLWKSDGTAAGTQLVAFLGQIAGLLVPDSVEWIPELGADFFAQRMGGVLAPPAQLWKTDGTMAELVRDTPPQHLRRVGDTLFFFGPGGLWKSDGTTAGTVLVSGVSPLLVDDHVAMDGLLFFNATDGSTGYEMWRSDGTTAGTVLVKDINPGSASGLDTMFLRRYVNPFVEMDGVLFFSADDGVHGRELWRSDGTEAGTMLVKDVNPGAAGSSPHGLVAVDGTLFFAADDGAAGIELWSSDGTEDGTTLVADIRSGSSGSDPAAMTQANGILFFRADDGISGAELWALGAPTTTSITTTTTSTSTPTTTSPPAACTPAPRSGCIGVARATLDVDEKRAGKEKLRVTLKGSARAVTPAELGDPVSGSTRVDVCVYDETSGLVAEVIVDRAGLPCGSKPCWKTIGSVGYRYTDTVGGADGTRWIVMKAGPAGKGGVKTLGANDAAKGQTALPTGLATALSGQTQAAVQIVTDGVTCFGATLTNVKKNTTERFRATAP